MSKTEILFSVEPENNKKGRELVTSVIDPEIAKLEGWFRHKDHGGTSLTPMERELLRSYLYQKLLGGL